MDGSWRHPRRLILALLGGLTIFFLIAPTLIIIPMSFTEGLTLEFPPEGFTLDWYRRVLDDEAWKASLVNSLKVGALTAVFATVLGTAATLAIVRGRFIGRSIVAAIALSPLVIPVVIVAVGMFAVYARLKLIGSLPGLVAAHTALAVPFVIVSVGTSLRTIDTSLEPAARGLGAGRIQTFRRITLPLALPGVLAGALFAFVTSWDEVVAAIFLTSADFNTLPVKVWAQITEVVDPTVAAVSTLLLGVSTVSVVVALAIRGHAGAA